MMELKALEHYLADYLDISGFNDYCPNGLQVEGRPQVKKIITGVTACEALIDKALELNADAILVHHGYFWKGEDNCLVGAKKNRIKKLLANDTSLFAFHLPLDCHDVVGNNIRLTELLGLQSEGALDFHQGKALGLLARTPKPMEVEELSKSIEKVLGRQPLLLGPGSKQISKVALCTGGAQSMFEKAICDHDIDAYITGEVSEPNQHLAQEYGVNFIAAGHHATERYGIQALGAHLAETFDLVHEFIDIANPV